MEKTLKLGWRRIHVKFLLTHTSTAVLWSRTTEPSCSSNWETVVFSLETIQVANFQVHFFMWRKHWNWVGGPYMLTFYSHTHQLLCCEVTQPNHPAAPTEKPWIFLLRQSKLPTSNYTFYVEKTLKLCWRRIHVKFLSTHTSTAVLWSRTTNPSYSPNWETVYFSLARIQVCFFPSTLF